MFVTVISVNMMQFAVNNIVRVIAVRNGLVTTTSSMLVGVGMGDRFFCGGERAIDGQFVFSLNTLRTGMVQVAVMEVIHMVVMLDGRVSTIWTVFVGMLLVLHGLCAKGEGSADDD